MASINLKPIHKRLSINMNEMGVDLDFIICIIWYIAWRMNESGPYSSLKKKIFDFPFHFVEEIFLFFPLNP